MSDIGNAEKIKILTSVITKMNRCALERRLADHKAGVSSLQHGILRILSYETRTISELSHKMMLDPSTLVPVVDTLEHKGLLRRGKDPKDRRRTPLFLTEQGAEVIKSIVAVDEADLLMSSLHVMGEEKAEQLVSLLYDLLRHMPDGEMVLAELDQSEKS